MGKEVFFTISTDLWKDFSIDVNRKVVENVEN